MKYFAFILALIVSNAVAEEIYLAKFKTMNPHVNGTLSGSATIYIANKKIIAYTRLFAGHPSVLHMQNIYLGDRCPSPQDDLNHDGYIDAVEGEKVWGNIIVPLDADISSQDSGSGNWPVADVYGTYFYEKESWYSNFINDLRRPDNNPNDKIAKLSPSETMQFSGKVVVVQGVGLQTDLPDTVLGTDGISAHKTLPIVCGSLKRIR